jgi:hypothetical protein
MSVLTKTSRPTGRTVPERSTSRRSLRELTRGYFAHERKWQFIIEALLFAIIVAISAWPIVAAVGALNEFLKRAVS